MRKKIVENFKIWIDCKYRDTFETPDSEDDLSPQLCCRFNSFPVAI